MKWAGRWRCCAFAPTLVVSGSPAYAEDGWQRIAIGELTFRLVKPCGRCVMTTLDPQTGSSADNEPLATLKRLRQLAARHCSDRI